MKVTLTAGLVAAGTLLAAVTSPASVAATDSPRPAKMSSATGTKAGPEKCFEDRNNGRRISQCYRMPRTVLKGNTIKIEGTRWWPRQQSSGEYNVEIRLTVLENSTWNSTHDQPQRTRIFTIGGSPEDPYETVNPDYSEDSWSATLPFPDSRTIESEDGRDVDALVGPGSVIEVDLLRVGTSDDGQSYESERRQGWFSVTRPAKAGEYAPRIIDQPESQAWTDGEDSTASLDVSVGATGKPKPRSLFEESAYEPVVHDYSETEGLWSISAPLTDRLTMTDEMHTFSEEGYPEMVYADAPGRVRAALINEIGNTYTEAANLGQYPVKVTTGADALVKESRLVNYFSIPEKVQRGRTITIKTGADRPGHTFGSRIYQGDAYRSFGWKTTNTKGNFTVKVPAKCSPGRHKFAVYDATGELYGWNYIDVTK